MANLTQLINTVRLQGETLVEQQLQMQAMQATSDNVWVLGRAFSVLTMVCVLEPAGSLLNGTYLIFAASWVRDAATSSGSTAVSGQRHLRRFAMLEAGLVSTRSTSNVSWLKGWLPANVNYLGHILLSSARLGSLYSQNYGHYAHMYMFAPHRFWPRTSLTWQSDRWDSIWLDGDWL